MWFQSSVLMSVALGLLVNPLAAQNTATSATAASQSHARAVTPAEYSFGIDLYVDGNLDPVYNGILVRPDSVFHAVDKKLDTWLQYLQAHPVKGLQLDPYGKLYVQAGNDAMAVKQFDERLSTPGLGVGDQAYTLSTAITILADYTKPGRMEAARKYLKRLDALPDSFDVIKYRSHFGMAMAFRAGGAIDSAIAHFKTAFTFAPHIPFKQRENQLFAGGGPFLAFADAVSGKPNAAAQLEQMGKFLMTLTTPSAEVVAEDPNMVFYGQMYQRSMRDVMQFAGYLGKPAPPVVAMRWLNTSTISKAVSGSAPGATQMALNDGKVRLIEFGGFHCIPCMKALPIMDSLNKTMPKGAEVWFVTSTAGVWGFTPRTPQEETENLAHFYTVQKGYSLPIALWAGPLEKRMDGGSEPRANPTFTALPITAEPTFMITDGKGIVRHITVGHSEQKERMWVSTLKALAAEMAQ